MKIKFDDKSGWVIERKGRFATLAYSPEYPEILRKRLIDHHDGLYETPKTFNADGIAHNDGSWLIYNTFRSKDGKYRGKILCWNKEQIIKHIYGYLCFLRKVGIHWRDEMEYYTICYIEDKLTFPKGVFNCTKPNIRLIEEKVYMILSKEYEDVDCTRKDKRKFCMDPAMKKDMSRSDKVRLEKAELKKETYEFIAKYYDPRRKPIENLMEFRKHGKPISDSTLKRWKREYKGVIWFFDEENDIIINHCLSGS